MANKNFNILRAGELEILARHKAAPCVSIFAPMRNGIFKTKEGPVRFSNGLKLAKKFLEKDFLMQKTETDKFLKPADMLINDHFFWKTPSDGLAVFIGRDLFKAYRLPARFPESVTVGNFFDLKPLFPLLMGNQHFYLLLLAKKRARLFTGTRYAVNEIKSSMPDGGDYFQMKTGDRRIEAHGVSGGYKAAVFHGHGGAKDAQHQMTGNFFRAINKEIRKILMFETAPLLVSGSEELTAIYQKVNGYNNLLTGGKEILAAAEDEKGFLRQAWRAVRPYFEKKISDQLKRFEQMSGSGKTSTDPETIVAAAADGRVEILFCANNARLWGKFDRLTSIVTVNTAKSVDDEDLLARAALETFAQKGLVYILSHDELPKAKQIAAIFRY